MALNKFYAPIDKEVFWHKWDWPLTYDAIRYAGFPKEIQDDIWEKEIEYGVFWD